MLKSLLAHPLTRGKDIDDSDTTRLRRQIIASKPFLRRLYEDWYSAITDAIPEHSGRILELGSGAGFLKEFVPDVIRSEVFVCPEIDVVADGRQLPFGSGTLRAIVMTDVFHHIPDAESFLAEAARCLSEGGRIIMWEPWVSSWSSIIYRHLHHEPFEPSASSWSFPSSGPLSGANGALPWIIFERDRARLERRHPVLKILKVDRAMPIRYILSGGVSLRSLVPGWSYGAIAALERLATPWIRHLAMFAFIVIEKRSGDA